MIQEARRRGPSPELDPGPGGVDALTVATLPEIVTGSTPPRIAASPGTRSGPGKTPKNRPRKLCNFNICP